MVWPRLRRLCRQAQALEFPVPGSDPCAALCICSRALAVYICESRVAWSLLFQAFKVHQSGVRSEGLSAARSRLLFVNSFALPLPELEWYSSLLVAWEASGVSRRLDSDLLALRTSRGLSVRSRMIRKQATPGLPCGTVGGETIWEGSAGNTESGI